MNQSEEEKRELRRKRRIKAQLLAYLTATVVMVILIVGGFVIASKLPKFSKPAAPVENVTTPNVDIPSMDEEELVVPKETPTPEPTHIPTKDELLNEAVAEFISGMTLEDKVAGLFIVNPESITGVATAIQAGDATKKALADYPVGGVIYYKKNMKSIDQLKEMISVTASAIKYPAFITVKEEGGPVSSVANAKLAGKMDSPSKLAEGLDAAKAYETGAVIGNYLAEFGFNLNLAPNADLAVEGGLNTDRLFGTAPATVTSFASNMYLGFRSSGVNAVCGHFPGMGAADKDPENGLSHITKAKDEMLNEDIEVFRTLVDSGVSMLQTTNVACEALTGSEALPCTFSEEVITGILRNDLGYDGVVITDHLNQKIITDYYGSGEAAVMALKAGCDMLLEPENFEEAYEAILGAVSEGVISVERIDMAITRIYKVKLENTIEVPTVE